jgi:uncharacterized protein (TIGR03435 family)
MRQVLQTSCAAVIVTILAFSANISTAQPPQQQAKSLQFEVAVIRPGKPLADWPPGESRISNSGSGGQFRMVNVPLKQWVEIGLSVNNYGLKAPSWLDTSRFDLDARLPAAQNAKPEMLKALLIERFGLKWHEELQSVSGFELVPDKKVLVQSSSLLERLEGPGSSSGPGLIGGTDMPMSEFAEALGKVFGRPVVDATHLSGGFDIKLMWRPDGEATAAEWRRHGIDVDNLPDSITTALREQLGLRLQSAKVPSKVVVVDNINRQPTEN